jgi:uncharacterized phage infection (PIP) family protein YhgE
MKTALILTLLATLVLPIAAQRRDPLNTAEIDQLRETAQEPIKRLPLMVKFARARMDALEQLRTSEKPDPDRAAKVRELLEDFGTLMDQLDDNVDDYADRGEDLRKPLKEVIEAYTDFQAKLKTWKESAASDPAAAKEMREYSFVLEDTADAVNSGLDNAKKLLADQIAHRGELKKK